MLLASLLPTDPPTADAWYHPMLLPWLLAAVAAFLYFKGLKEQSYGSKAPYKHLALPLSVGAFFLSLLPLFSYFTNFLYRELIDSGKVKMALFLAPVAPLLAISAIGIHLYLKWQEDHRHDFLNHLYTV